MRDPLVIGVFQPYSPPAVNRGYANPLQQWYETNFDPTSGYTNRVEYKGLDWTAAQTLANYFTSLGISANLRNERGSSTLTITDATGNYVIDKWELSVDREQPDVFENPLFLSLINSAAKPEMAIGLMRNALKNAGDLTDPDTVSGWDAITQLATPVVGTTHPLSGVLQTYGAAQKNPSALRFVAFALGQPFYVSAPALDTSIVSPATNASGASLPWTSVNMVKLKQYFDAYNLGVTNFLRGKYRLRHTSNIPANWNVSVADFNVEKIYTISQLITECTGGGFIYPLPNYLSYKILNYVPDPVAAWTPYYTFGALKEKSDAVTAVNNRIDLVTEYLIDNINTNLYLHI